ncbi:TonB-dependent receptor (plasmid) [Lichenicola cladoniae]|uniref:TonB-dependent receptor n=1 Tax=Lichenicola cladoniae TaxID=1484109 RepID=A0A6M8HY28_9PROT|nr:TonB-dependent receptor [Lichenicola cladoniae]QKE93459.1 TonB-dependent receptor [Lichenicola cladoniae]
MTGSILRNPNLSGASPVTHLTARDMQARGITTVAAALQQISANNAGNLPASFTGNGAFASGASGVSLRGLTVDSTLVLIDGQRAAYYPLSDDGERNFVDINTIPQSIVQTIDVEQDGASATYGADAVAGVVNIITRKQIEGFEGGAEGGLSQRADSGHQRLYSTYGIGDLNRDGYNVYLNGEYQNDDMLYNRDRGYPYNTGDLRGLGGLNGNANGIQDDGTISGVGATRIAAVRPVTVDPTTGALTSLAGLRPINSTLGCNGLATHVVSQGTVCEQNTVGDYRVISPSDRRISANLRGTANVSDRAQAYAMFTYAQNQVYFTGTPSSIRQQSASADVSLTNIVLPALLANGSLNPNNPFAAQGQAAQIYYRFADLHPTTTDFNQTFRGSTGINGTIGSQWGSDWSYGTSVVGMTDDLQVTTTGVPTYAGILNAVNTGSYNFVDPSKNSSAVRESVAPKSVQHASSQEYAFDVTLSKGLFSLPGGMVTLGIGGAARYESLNDPSANPDDPSNPNAQYLPQINGFGASGSRRVGSGYFEAAIPLIKRLTVSVSGRYDNYSEGFSNFAPKVGVILKPIDKLMLRGTFSKGFRVPSFAETGASPTIGYISYTPTDPAFLAQHQNSNGTGPDAYAQTYSLGLNSVGNPALKPEKSTNFTGGGVLTPVPWLNLTADYYHIKKNNFITLADYSGPVANYFTSKDYPAGITVTPDVADPDHPEATILRPGIVNLGYINAAKLVTSGVDLALSARIPLPRPLQDIKWTSTGQATYVLGYTITYPGIGLESYAGSLGPANVTSASGTPRWRANWANTFTYKRLAVTATVNYTSGYKLTAEDVTGPGTLNDCSQAQQGFAGDPQRCGVASFVDVDLTINYALNDRLNLYTNIYNVFDKGPPLDTGTYGGYQYNPAWASAGILGRAFRFGVTGKF